jgi:antiviral helicase SLH1
VTASTGDASHGNGELLALKRVSWFNPQNRNKNSGQNSRGQRRNNGTTAKATVKFPEEFLLSSQPTGAAATRKVDVLIVSDSYIGMEWKTSGVEIPVFSDSNGEGPSSRLSRTVDVDARVEKK